MRKIIFIALTLLLSTVAFGQKKEKVKGSKIVTIEQKQVESFDAIEVGDDLEISLIKGDKNGVELEADDNLQNTLSLTMMGSTLVITAAKDATDFKKFNIRVTYTDAFKTVTAKGKSKINALEEITLDDITFKSFDNSKLFLNLATKSFSIICDDRSKAELNAKSESGTITLSKNAEIKALIASTELKCDLYQKAVANIEGDVIDMTLRLDNNSGFTGKKLTVKNMKLVAEGYSNCNVYVETTVSIEASGTSEIQLYGEPKVDLVKFADSAILSKKPSK
ncbi:MAG: DUF2807 domain-containing protein [Flavobacterium sp.]|nr:DUF2807 domain-containing protein [Flavobacterium sp.]